MSRTNFEDLEVYQLSEQLADSIWEIVIEWPYFEKDTIGKQLVRAVDSIGSNIVEGIGRKTFRENKRFVRIARGSLYETKYWLRRCVKRKLLIENQITHLKPLIDELLPRLNSYYNSIGKGHAPYN